MVILITGASHTGKTLLAQKLLERFHFPYLSMDHLKMGLIRSGQTDLTPYDEKDLTPYLWSIVREMIKTAIENEQDLIVEGCYLPLDWKKDFSPDYLKEIRCLCLVMNKEYIEDHFADIMRYADAIEKRLDDSYSREAAIRDNAEYLQGCKGSGCPYYEITDGYDIDAICDQF